MPDKDVHKPATLEGSTTAVPATAGLLDRISDFLGRFVAYPSQHARVAHVLWIVHTHLMDCWDSTPRLAFLSPEPGSGKSRALEVTELLVPRPVHAVNTTPAYLFRKVSDPAGQPTILYDEIDALFGPKAKGDEDIRAMLNAGHRRGATAGRCVVRGKVVETEELPSYCAVALAGLGYLPDTILTRSVVVRMRRRSSSEQVENFRRRLVEPEAETLRHDIAVWAEQHTVQCRDTFPDMPPGVEDRNADVWESLLAIAEAAGTSPGPNALNWPTEGRAAAVALVEQMRTDSPSLGVRLLSDIREIMADKECTSLSTEGLLRNLRMLVESPWAELGGKPLDPRTLAKRLSQYGISSRNLRIEGRVVKGYAKADFQDAWSRYLPEATQSEDIAEVSGLGPVGSVCTNCNAHAVTVRLGVSLCHRCASAEAKPPLEDVS